eukprot:GHVU01052708.1.p1 GENE.GHVU01052708.1~~GHVU01052708.1.p1  ORF type:complete len:107 (-),score=13.89 GHVU01052708.1:240-560(-)
MATAASSEEEFAVPHKAKRMRVDHGRASDSLFADSTPVVVRNQENSKHEMSRKCPFLGTINRHLLDFDFEKLCSVCLSNLHVYACLICGKYFQGTAAVAGGGGNPL